MPEFSRRTFLQGTGVAAAAAALSGVAATTTIHGVGDAGADSTAGGYLVGAGKGDMTGAVAGQGMMGYSDFDQIAAGFLQRLWARAYVIADAATGKRILFINTDTGKIFTSHHQTLLAELKRRYGGLYTAQNVNVNATHNHNSCGGVTWDYMFSIPARGFRENSFKAEMAGILDAVERAHDSVAPGTVELGHTELHDASANRSLVAFEKNPVGDRRHFPENIDPQVTAIRLRSGGRIIGEITWFATHGTSLTDANSLIGPDNKGLASYLGEQREPGMISAHAQTNAGDMSPNLWLRKLKASGPTADHQTNRDIIGRRQDAAGQRALASARPMSTTRIDSATRYVDMANIHISGHYTPHAKAARTSPAMFGVSWAATSQEDNTSSQFAFLNEGIRDEFAMALGAGTTPTPDAWVIANQAPKVPVLPVGLMPPRPWMEQRLPLQLIRIGDLVLVAIPAEVTIVAGLRIRRVVADTLGAPLENVILQGYANSTSQYVVTPEEYLAQQYEGASTLFGRWTLCAYMQEFDAMARAMKRGNRLATGPRPARTAGVQPDLLERQPADTPIPGRRFGQVISAVPASIAGGKTLEVSFCGAYPTNRIRRRPATSGYFTIERFTGTGWEVAFDDDSYATVFHWKRPAGNGSASKITVTWRIPQNVAPGDYRVRYFGDVKSASGALREISGSTGRIRVG